MKWYKTSQTSNASLEIESYPLATYGSALQDRSKVWALWSL